MPETDIETELAEIRDAVNHTRVTLRGLQQFIRNTMPLVHDLEERLEHYDNRLHQLQRIQAQEAQINARKNHSQALA